MKRYFPGLNALRLYAALSVAVGHIWSYGGNYTPSEVWHRLVDFATLSGQDAVTLFFVLSGFLITYLLIDEQGRTSTVNVKQFYARRARRILPLYVATAALTLLLMPSLIPLYGKGMDAFSLATIVLLSGHVGSAFGFLGYMGHFWSLGCEEWFYAALPPLVKKVRIPRLVIAVVVLRLLVTVVINPSLLMISDVYGSPVYHFIQLTRFDAMAFGGLGAWLVYNRHPALKLIYRLEVPAWIITAVLIVLPISDFGGVLYDMAAAMVFMVLIVSVATKPRPALSLEHHIVRELGVLTYGIYMNHALVIYLIAPLLPKSAWLILITPLLSVGIAFVTYRVIERPLLHSRVRTAAIVDAASAAA